VTDVWSASTAGSNTGPRLRLWDRLFVIPLICGLSVAAVFLATLLSPVAPAGADQVSDLQAQAAQLSQEMLREQLQIGGFEQQRSADMSAIAQANQELTATEAQISATHERIAHDLTVLEHAAVNAYVAGGTAAEGTNPLFANDRSSGQRSVYEQVVTGNLSAAVDQLRADRHVLQTQEASQQALVAQAQQEESQAAVFLADAQSTQQTLQAQSAQVNGQLAVAVAQQQAAQQAAASAAVAAAQAKAQAAASSVPAASGAPGAPAAAVAPAGSTVTPALPAFLVCVVQAESSGNYGAVSPTGTYMGAFQFSQATWNEAALLAGRPTLVGVPPNQASPADQDALAIALYSADGEAPWYDPCRTG
jgi:peptidoglycan hydrolase CwlO-like protein